MLGRGWQGARCKRGTSWEAVQLGLQGGGVRGGVMVGVIHGPKNSLNPRIDWQMCFPLHLYL